MGVMRCDVANYKIVLHVPACAYYYIAIGLSRSLLIMLHMDIAMAELCTDQHQQKMLDKKSHSYRISHSSFLGVI